MTLKIIDKKNIELNGKAYVLTDTLTNEEILTALRRGVLSTTTGNIIAGNTTEIIKTGTKTFTLNGDSFTLDTERTEEQLLRDLSNKGFVKLNNNIYLNTAGTGGTGGNTNSNALTRIKHYQTKYVETAGTGKGTGGDTGIATSNTAIDMFSLFFTRNYKDYILKNRDNLEISFIVGDRRSFILPRRLERTPYFTMNDLLNQTLIQAQILNIDYNFNCRIDTNLNIKMSDNHTGQPNLFGATFAITLRWKV